MGCAGHVVHSGVSGTQNGDTLFFMLEWYRCRLNKKCAESCYTKLVFLLTMGSVHHVVHSSASRLQTLVHYFSCSDGTYTDLTKSSLGHVILNL
jgi:hypothetical protein